MNVKKLLQLFVGYLQIERNYSKYTIASYQNDLEHFVQFMEREGISSFFRRYIRGCSFVLNNVAR